MNKGLQHKFLNYEAEPPAGVWDKINGALEEEADKPFPERLFHYEEDPPPFLWDNIVAVLDEHQIKTIPFRKRYSKPLRYSTAAACLIAIAVLITLLNKKSVSEELTNTATQKALPDITEQKNQKDQEKISVPLSNNEGNMTVQTKDKIPRIHIKNSSPSFKRANYVVAGIIPKAETDLPERYIIYSTSTGDAFRISKKLFDLFACSDENQKCKENIEIMQQQMASPAIMASADFSGLLDLLQSINNQ